MWMPGILQRPETQDFSGAKVTDVHKLSKKGDGNWIQVFCKSNKHSKPLNHLCSPVSFLRVELLYTQQKSNTLSPSFIIFSLSLPLPSFPVSTLSVTTSFFFPFYVSSFTESVNQIQQSHYFLSFSSACT